MAAALEEAVQNMTPYQKNHSDAGQAYFGASENPFSQLTGDPVNRLPGTASSFLGGVEGEAMVLTLDNAGICASSGSACSSASLDPSHVLLAIGLKHEVAHGSLRLAINETTSDADIDYIIETVPRVVEKLRAMSPLWEDKLSGKF
jgi:cysteine desulfurase